MKPIDTEKIFIERHFKESINLGKVDEEQVLLLEQLAGDASTRRYYRLVTNSTSYVVCLDQPFDKAENYPFLKIHSFFESNNIRVPEVYDHLGNSGYLLEEDLGDITLLQYMSNKDFDEELRVYKLCIDNLVDLQSIDSNHIPDICKQLKFDYSKLYGEIEMTFEYFYKYLGVDEDATYSLEKNIIAQEFQKICRYLENNISTLCHRDYHSRNIMVLGEDDPEFVTIDFQDARMGSYGYDLVSLLDDCYYKLRGANVAELKLYYHAQMSSKVQNFPSIEEFDKLYDISLIQRVFKAIGSFAYIYDTRKDARYLKYIGFAMEKLKSVLIKNSEFLHLKNALFKIYYEN